MGSYIAAAYGAEIFERHITLDKNMEGPDHHCSDELKDFSFYVKNIKAIKLAIGNGIKDIHESRKIENSFKKKRLLEN